MISPFAGRAHSVPLEGAGNEAVAVVAVRGDQLHPFVPGGTAAVPRQRFGRGAKEPCVYL